MQSRHWTLRILCGLTLLTLAGCYSSNPYGASGYPGYYSAPPTGGVPQGVAPQNGFGPGSAPQTFSSPAPAGANWQPSHNSEPNGGAPFFNPGTPQEVVVPDPGANTFGTPADGLNFQE